MREPIPMERSMTVFLTIMVVMATVPAGVAVAQTDPTVERTFTERQEYVGVDTGNFSGTFTMKVTAGDAPGGPTTLYQEQMNGTSGARFQMFANYGAYANITVAAIPGTSSSGELQLVDGSERPDVRSSRTIASTGGDADLQCGIEEQIQSMITPDGFIVDCGSLPGTVSSGDELSGLDAQETKTELYGSLSTAEEQAKVANDSRANALTMTLAAGRMTAKNAYIRSLENGSTEATARNRAHNAIDDFLTVQEIQSLNQWDIQVTELERAHNHAEAEQNVTADQFINGTIVNPDGSPDNAVWRNITFKNETVTLLNGSTKTVRVIEVAWERWNDGSTPGTVSATLGPWDSRPVFGPDTDEYPANITIAQPYPEYSGGSFEYLDADPNPYQKTHATLVSQEQTLNGDANDFINNTYDSWEAGEINSSDLVDPYLAAQEYSPSDDYQVWALNSLVSVGQQTPGNLSQFGNMTITDLSTNTTRTGILLSDGLPEGNSFTTDTTYDAANLTGPQYILTNESTHQLEGEFRIDAAYTADGTNQTVVNYTTVNYQTSNISEYKATIEDLQMQMAELNALQDRLRNSQGGGGGGLLGGDMSLGVAVGIIAAFGAVILLGRSG